MDQIVFSNFENKKELPGDLIIQGVLYSCTFISTKNFAFVNGGDVDKRRGNK